MRRLLTAALAVVLLLPPTGGASTTDATSADPLAPYLALPPGERYWQLRFLLAVTDGMDEALVEKMDLREGGRAAGPLDPQTLENIQGAGLRIADAGHIVDGMAELARYRQGAEADILAEIETIAEDWPELIGMLDEERLLEEALLVRLAIQDSLEAVLGADAAGNADYRVATLRTRNDLEYIAFERQVDKVTDHAIEQTEGRLDAFHRMVDDEYNLEFLRERVLAAEDMNASVEAEHRRYALMRTMRTLMIMAPMINRYFYYD